MSTQSIYEQIGGAEAVEMVVALFYEHMLADPEIQPFFRGVQMSRQQQKQVQFITQALGGPAIYHGKDMVTAHKGMGIRDRHFDLLVKHMTAALREAGVEQRLIDQILGALAPLRSQVVELEQQQDPSPTGAMR